MVIPRFGIPEKIYSDNGTHFVNNVISLMAKNLKTGLKNHCAYHPQSACLLERHNGIIKSRLKKIIEETELGLLSTTSSPKQAHYFN